MSDALTLLSGDGSVASTALNEAGEFNKPTDGLRSRVAYAAAHVAPVAWAENTPGQPAEIDWDATLAFRRNVYSWGLGVADAMDTAQRNMGLDAAAVRELIARSAQVAREEGGSVAVGVNTDHLDEPDRLAAADHRRLPPSAAPRRRARRRPRADGEQAPGPHRRVSRGLPPRLPRGAEDATTPVVLHWLGTAFDPQLAGYFGSTDWREASDVVVEIITEHTAKIAGIKMSLLDADAEVSVRERLPEGVRMFTGDDFNYVGLIGGADVPDADQPERSTGTTRTHSDALLGAFAALAPVASAAIQALDAGDPARYLELLQPTEALQPAGFRCPDVLLQDRRRLLGMAERAPARIPDGGRPAFGAFAAPSQRDRAPCQRCARSREARPGRRAVAFAAAPERSRRMTAPHPRLSINQATIKKTTAAEAIRVTTVAGIGAIGLWREQVQDAGLDETAKMIAGSGLRYSTHCRGGWFTAEEADAHRSPRRQPRRDRRDSGPRRRGAAGSRAVLVLVVGGLPDGSRDLVGARERVRDAIARLAPHAQQQGVQLALEPLHPMYASDRSVLSTLDQALDIAADFAPEVVGVTVDTFHLWWDPNVLDAIARAGPRGSHRHVSGVRTGRRRSRQTTCSPGTIRVTG